MEGLGRTSRHERTCINKSNMEERIMNGPSKGNHLREEDLKYHTHNDMKNMKL